MGRFVRIVSVCITCVSLAGCALHIDAETLGIRATVSEPAGEQVDGVDFEVSKKAVFLLWGVLPVTRPSLEDALAGQLVDGDGIANLEMHVRPRFADLLVTAITLGIIVPRSVTYSGTVVKNP